ncbi:MULTISPECIES: matrixin family metalloprotease [Paenibacillus]|uniref:Matrixin n=1 Tax=Paenibacillus pabuli TaxID=1472 RepID=A0A855XKW2_9BACL|nr:MULTISPECIES: matrixin family metalloprotease [Paenibacillus]PWW33355.1 matrixin [Paenibacillus pabuli]PXW08402.1 matrixin [Paenibacillus taichungensis]RAI99208.1 matrixin [Paenibacillus pabuli]
MSKKQLKKPLIIAGSLLLLMSCAGTSFAAYSHDLYPNYWQQGRSSVTYSVQSTFDSTTKTQMQTAMSQWNNALPSGSFLYKSASDTNDSTPSQNNINTITKYPYGADGFTGEHVPYLNSAGKVIESDIRINSSHNWSNSPKPNYRDIQSTMTHEFGHSLRVGHSPIYEDTMFGEGSLNTDYKRTLTTADREAAQASVSRWITNSLRTNDDESSKSDLSDKVVVHSEAEVIQFDKNQLVNEADVIVSGTVIFQEVKKDFEGFPVTDTTIRVQTVYKGEPGETVTIRVKGGETDNMIYTLNKEASPTFKIGEEAIVFLTGNKGSRPDKDDFGYYLVGQAQGKFDSGIQSQSQGVAKNSTDTHSLDLNNIQNEINLIEKYNKLNNIPKLYLPEGQESNI